jgi:hypothetical protein
MSKKKENRTEDFPTAGKDTVFTAIIQKIGQENLEQDDYQYIEDYEKQKNQFEAHEATVRRHAVYDTKIEIATNCKKLNIDIKIISQATGLSVEEIKKL